MRTVSVAVALLLAASCAYSQEVGAPSQYTIHAQTRVVLTDVTVTDRNGNPVHGLKASDFHLFDNHQAQKVASFEEHTPGAATSINTSAKAGVFSNEFLQHLPPVLNVLLLDTAWMPLDTQMELNVELGHFLERFPEDQPLAIYLKRGDHCVLLQDFTTDRGLLTNAMHQAIPWLHAMGTEYPDSSTPIRTLHEIAVDLGSIPGRKNLLWFSSGINLPSVNGIGLTPTGSELRPLYDELEAYRISLYPVDVRGLMLVSNSMLIAQHRADDDFAEATGGHAFNEGNDIAGATLRTIDLDRNFYTITYAPANFENDNKWHTVEVKVDDLQYTLSYRRGYYADGFDRTFLDAKTQDPASQRKPDRTRLMANGSSLKVDGETRTPIVFEATVHADSTPASAASLPPIGYATPPKHDERISVSYSVPASALLVQDVEGRSQVVLGTAAVIVTREGRVLTRRADKFIVTINREALAQRPDAKVHVEQKIDAAKGEHVLELLVWDLVTHRQGRIQIPLQVPLAQAVEGRE